MFPEEQTKYISVHWAKANERRYRKLAEMCPAERSKYICERRAKENERRYKQTHRTGSKSESTGPIFLEEDTQNHNTADTIDKTVNLLWTNTGQYETIMSQMLHETVDLEEQVIILQQLQAVIKKNNLNTIDAVDDIAHMCNNYTKQMAHDLLNQKVRADQRYFGYRHMHLNGLDPLLKFSIQQQQQYDTWNDLTEKFSSV